MDDKSPFSPYRQDGKLFGFVAVVTGADQPIGKAISLELAGTEHLMVIGIVKFSTVLTLIAHGTACIYGMNRHNTSEVNSFSRSKLAPALKAQTRCPPKYPSKTPTQK